MAEDQAPYDATDETLENNVRSEAARVKREDADVLRKIMQTKTGRAWLYRQLDRCNIYSFSFSGEETHLTAYKLGAENYGKQLMLETIDASGDLYLTMIREQREEESRQAKEVKKRAEKAAGVNQPPLTPQDQSPDLPPPPGWPGHKPPPQA